MFLLNFGGCKVSREYFKVDFLLFAISVYLVGLKNRTSKSFLVQLET